MTDSISNGLSWDGICCSLNYLSESLINIVSSAGLLNKCFVNIFNIWNCTQNTFTDMNNVDKWLEHFYSVYEYSEYYRNNILIPKIDNIWSSYVNVITTDFNNHYFNAIEGLSLRDFRLVHLDLNISDMSDLCTFDCHRCQFLNDVADLRHSFEEYNDIINNLHEIREYISDNFNLVIDYNYEPIAVSDNIHWVFTRLLIGGGDWGLLNPIDHLYTENISPDLGPFFMEISQDWSIDMWSSEYSNELFNFYNRWDRWHSECMYLFWIRR